MSDDARTAAERQRAHDTEEIIRLRARVAELETAGDRVARSALALADRVPGPLSSHVRDVDAKAQAWRSLRGDAATDGQAPDAEQAERMAAARATDWDRLPAADRALTAALVHAAAAARDELAAVTISVPRLSSTSAAIMADWLVRHGWPPVAAPADDTTPRGTT